MELSCVFVSNVLYLNDKSNSGILLNFVNDRSSTFHIDDRYIDDSQQKAMLVI